MTTRVYIEELTYPQAGQYKVRLGSADGDILLAASRSPLLDACRALKRLNIVGRAEMWDASRPYPRAWADIDKGAELRIVEDRNGLGVTKFTPFERFKKYAAHKEISHGQG